jgi:hypothetical protein
MWAQLRIVWAYWWLVKGERKSFAAMLDGADYVGLAYDDFKPDWWPWKLWVSPLKISR